MARHIRRRPALLMGLTLVASFSAGAQEGGAGSSGTLEEVMVTAQRRAENIQDVPIAISALDGRSLVDRGITSVMEISGTVPSVNIQNRRSSGVVTIRGIGFEVATAGADPAVAVHVDGVYIARPPAALVNFYDIDRVEIARGPQGTLYGRNATGGALNIITRRPTSEFSGYVDAAMGNYGAITAEGALSGPLGTDKLLARISAKIDQHDGYGSNRFLGSEINDLDTQAARLQLLFNATDDLTFLLSADHFEQDDNFYQTIYGGYASPCVTTPPGRRCGTAYGGLALRDEQDVLMDYETINEREFSGVSLTAEWTGAAATLRSITGYRETQYLWHVDGDETTFDIGYVGRDEDAEQFSQELQLLGDSGKLRWLLGGFYFTETNDALGYADIPVPDFRTLIIRQFGQLETDAWALFAQATYEFNDVISLTLGGRYSDEEKSIVGEVSQQLPGVIPPPRPTRTETWSKFTPKATLDFKFTSDMLLYVTAQQGFKSGGYAAGALTPAFDPEEVWSYELGFKSTWLGGVLQTNLAAFHYDYKNLQVGFVQNLPGGAVVTVVTNAASAKADGFEAEIVARPTDRLTLEANLGWLDAHYDEFFTVDPNRPAFGVLDLAGNQLAQAPEFTAMTAATYEWPALGGSLSMRGEYQYTDEVFFDAYNRRGVMSEDSYGLVNGFLTWERDKWKVSLYGRNLADKGHTLGGAIGGAIWGSPIYIVPGTPRLYGVRASVSF